MQRTQTDACRTAVFWFLEAGIVALFFFHEYGRRVGMVLRSSLKEGKYNQMVEKRTKTTQQQTKQNQPQPTGGDSTTK